MNLALISKCEQLETDLVNVRILIEALHLWLCQFPATAFGESHLALTVSKERIGGERTYLMAS
jgi:hypothetical protein